MRHARRADRPSKRFAQSGALAMRRVSRFSQKCSTRAALQGFAKRDDDSFLTVLSGLDVDPHWAVRAGLATILGSKDPERSLARLTPMLADADARVIPAVLTAMTKLKAPGMAKILVE